MAKLTITTDFPEKENLTKLINDSALKHGFDACGVCPAQELPKDKKHYLKWLDRNYHAGMKYLEKNLNVRFDTRKIIPGTKSLVVVLKNYHTNSVVRNPLFSMAKYAFCKDYHILIKEKLKKILKETKKVHPVIKGRAYVDTAPIFERSNAVNAGLGFIGKNTCLIHPKLGSFTFIGVLALDIELNYNSINRNYSCGDCNLCIESCPTGALDKSGLNASKCISYHTIENKGLTPKIIREKITDQIFGCDICQKVCPYNAEPADQNDPDFNSLEIIERIDPEVIRNMTDKDFNDYFKDTVLLRAGRKKILENFGNVTNKSSTE